jgi:hypothetical protein
MNEAQKEAFYRLNDERIRKGLTPVMSEAFEIGWDSAISTAAVAVGLRQPAPPELLPPKGCAPCGYHWLGRGRKDRTCSYWDGSNWKHLSNEFYYPVETSSPASAYVYGWRYISAVVEPECSRGRDYK